MTLGRLAHGLLDRLVGSAQEPAHHVEGGYPAPPPPAAAAHHHHHHHSTSGHPHAGSENDQMNRRMTVMTLDPSALIPAEDKLLIFRTLTGIDTVPVVSRSGHTVRPAANIGIHTRVVRNERLAKKGYRTGLLAVNSFLGLQIIVGAALTALGAAKGSYRAIMGLGVFNTILAGALAYVKGSGLPNKFKHQEYEWRKIREYIEQRERELCLADSGLDVYHEVRVVEEMYYRVREELLATVKEPSFQAAAAQPPPQPGYQLHPDSGVGRPKSDLSRSYSMMRGQNTGSEMPYGSGNSHDKSSVIGSSTATGGAVTTVTEKV